VYLLERLRAVEAGDHEHENRWFDLPLRLIRTGERLARTLRDGKLESRRAERLVIMEEGGELIPSTGRAEDGEGHAVAQRRGPMLGPTPRARPHDTTELARSA